MNVPGCVCARCRFAAAAQARAARERLVRTNARRDRMQAIMRAVGKRGAVATLLLALVAGIGGCGNADNIDVVDSAPPVCDPSQISGAVLCATSDVPDVNKRGRDVFACSAQDGSSVPSCYMDFLTFVRNDGTRVEFECGSCPGS